MTLDELNTLDEAAFVSNIGWVFEHSPWVAARSWPSRPFRSRTHLHETMQRAVENATVDEQLALLRAHPDLGTRVAMSSASNREQSGAGLSQLDDATRARLQMLNEQYRARFGFPFLYAVKGATPAAILASLESRISNTQEHEFRQALTQVFRIAAFRLEDMLDNAAAGREK